MAADAVFSFVPDGCSDDSFGFHNVRYFVVFVWTGLFGPWQLNFSIGMYMYSTGRGGSSSIICLCIWIQKTFLHRNISPDITPPLYGTKKIITIKLQSPSFGWLRRTKTQSSKTEWRRQRWLGYEYWTRLAKRLYRQGCGCLDIGRWHTNESSWPCTKLCKYIKLDIRVFTLCFFCIRYTQHIYWMYFKKCEKKWTKWSLWANFRVTYVGVLKMTNLAFHRKK